MKYKGYEIEFISGLFCGVLCWDYEFIDDDLKVITSNKQFFERVECENAAKRLIDKIEGDKKSEGFNIEGEG